MKDIGVTKAGLFKLYICSMATHFAIFSDPVLSFIPSKKYIRTLFHFLRKMSTFRDLNKSTYL